MKGVFIFNHLNDVSFMQVDEEYKNHLNATAVAERHDSGDNGIELEVADDDTTRPSPLTPDINVVLQLFAPLLASQRFMLAQMSESYKAITCQNGFLFCIQQLGDDVYIAANGDDTESEMFLQHKLKMLSSIYRFLCGTIISSTRPEVSTMREERWWHIGQLLNTWCHLYSTEQAYLWRAMERLQINAALNAHCVGLLESALESMRAAGTTYPVHALLIVEAKLLALYSSHSASQLSSSDIQLITLLVNSSHHLIGRGKVSGSENTGSSEATNGEHERSDTTQSDSASMAASALPHNTAIELDDRRLSDASCTYPDLVATSQAYHGVNAFLCSDTCPVNPHRLYCIPIMSSMVLVVIGQLSRTSHAAVLYDTIARVTHILQAEGSTVHTECQQHAPVINRNVYKLHALHRRFKKSSEVRHVICSISNKWDAIKKTGFGGTKIPANPLTPRQESLLLSLRASHEHLFSLFYCRPRHVLPETGVNIAHGVEIIHAMLQRHLVDYVAFLKVKVQANVTMTAYEKAFPNLVFFSYINRTTGQIVVPLVNVLPQAQHDQISREKIWQKVQWIEKRLEDGYNSMIVREADLVYSYFSWVDHMPHSRGISKLNLPPDISHGFSSLCVRKEDQILRKHAPRYELFTIHTSNVPNAAYVWEDCRKLSARLWEMSASPSFHFSLL